MQLNGRVGWEPGEKVAPSERKNILHTRTAAAVCVSDVEEKRVKTTAATRSEKKHSSLQGTIAH